MSPPKYQVDNLLPLGDIPMTFKPRLKVTMIQKIEAKPEKSDMRRGIYHAMHFFECDWKMLLSDQYSWINNEYWDLCESLPPFEGKVSAKMMSALKRLIKYCPYHMDVVGHYARGLHQRGKRIEALSYAEMALSEGERAIKAAGDFKLGQHFFYYGDLDNRPFLRLIASAVDYAIDLGMRNRAAELCDVGLAYDPSNRVQLGLNRAVLAIELQEFDRIFQLFSNGPYENLPHDEYNIQEYLLLVVAKYGIGEMQEAELLFSEISRFALKTAEYLTTKKHVEVQNDSPIGGITMGSDFENFYFAEIFRYAISRVQGATEWLEAQVKKVENAK